ncbi:Kelch-like protein 17-like 1, partial [Homarus americanus]
VSTERSEEPLPVVSTPVSIQLCLDNCYHYKKHLLQIEVSVILCSDEQWFAIIAFVYDEMASWYPDIEMEETGVGGRGRGNGANGTNARGCIRPRHCNGASYRDSGEIKFCISEYKNDAFQMMLLMKSNQMLTDVKLEVGREIFHGHKIVLAAASPYFKMNHVIDACCTFLEQQLEAGNAIGIANFAQQHGCMDLYHKANTFIEQHFSEVSLEEEFLKLSSYQLVNLIQRDELNVPDEKDVYNAVLKWVMHDEDNRQPKMELILQAVR